MSEPACSELKAALDRFHVDVPDETLESFDRYCQLLWKWNAKLNLTRHTDFDAFVSRDLLDTKQISAHIPASAKILDVGSGGGVPGIPLSILRNDLTICLAESVQKKARALQKIVGSLKSPVTVHAGRAEDLLKKENYDVLTIRAVASLRKLLFWFQKVPNSFGSMLLIKGPNWKNEVAEAEEEGLLENASIEQIGSYRTPGHDGDSVVLSVHFRSASSE